MNHQDRQAEAGQSDPALRARAIESLLLEKGLITRAAVDAVAATLENDVGPLNGARVVARAWSDPEYKRRLLADGNAALEELGLTAPTEFIVMENTDHVHNMIVCTLCSCYPWTVLGLPPTWYKSPEYRARVVIEPRTVLAEFGVHLPALTQIRVWDSTAETRYMVLPRRPAHTEDWSIDDLVTIITRDSMVGAAVIADPAGSKTRP
ncbi:nitrile hydratase subunit alpha [Mycobacterium fragae]|uniref:nitrile hydratase n=1 Tax=Mycobacterium fragae TaxID=1260918 RepID=A0A1X1UNS6_9MYCO|nr:nitrile hydratase subunit alpha [Mycobacterium fragae]MCV7400191.1 nitrile hydratase subunit alpha [Mycobacterium fragae]ORV58505.1 nitrile hydratase subunit alpha [Mycobacterium fragae]